MSQTLGYEQLVTGLRFPPVTYTVDAQSVASYLKAVDSRHSLDDVARSVPPVIIAGLAMKGMMQQLRLEAGSIHLSQELEFHRPVGIGETVTCWAGVGKKQERSGLRMVSFELEVVNHAGEKVMSGRALVAFPGGKA